MSDLNIEVEPKEVDSIYFALDVGIDSEKIAGDIMPAIMSSAYQEVTPVEHSNLASQMRRLRSSLPLSDKQLAVLLFDNEEHPVFKSLEKTLNEHILPENQRQYAGRSIEPIAIKSNIPVNRDEENAYTPKDSEHKNSWSSLRARGG